MDVARRLTSLRDAAHPFWREEALFLLRSVERECCGSGAYWAQVADVLAALGRDEELSAALAQIEHVSRASSIRFGGASEAGRGEPEARRGEPEARRGEPEARRGEPEARRGEPEARRGEPEARRGEPEARRGEPEARRVEPEARRVEPEAGRGKPKAGRGEPEAESAAPTLQLLYALEPGQGTQSREYFDLAQTAEALRSARIAPVTEAAGGETDRARVEDAEEATAVVSETLAEIMERQGKFDDARKQYQALSERHPERSEYFQDRLRRIEDRIKGA